MLRTAMKYLRALLISLAIGVAVTIVAVATIDLGPAVRGRAERAGSSWLDRPMHIGRLGVHLGRGRFIVEDLRIEGLAPDARPWLMAKRIEVSLTWRALVERELLLDSIEMVDWRIVVESFPNGRHNWPRLNGPPRSPNTRPRPVVTTLQYVRAHRGEFIFDDHAARWGVVAPNLDVTVGKVGEYGGRASFHGGTVHFAGFLPMWANMSTNFKMEDGKVMLDRIDLTTDGAASVLTGAVDLTRWPEMLFSVDSQLQFPRMREIFFPNETFALHGVGRFTGTFRLFKGGREVKGRFASDEAGLNALRFQRLQGALEWLPDRFEVLDAESRFFGGRTQFKYLMAPLGRADQRGRARLDVEYDGVDLEALTNFLQLQGVRLAGAAAGRNRLEWPLGAFRDRTGAGSLAVTPPNDVVPLPRELPPTAVADALARSRGASTFDPRPPQMPVGLGAAMSYAFAGPRLTIADGQFATSDTHIAFHGETDLAERSRLPFHVTSTSWQESDRLLAGLMTAFGVSTSAIAVDGVGEFDGVMLGAFRRPRIEGQFRGEAMRVFDVVWGSVHADVVIENAYATVAEARVRTSDSEIGIDGRFSLGFPRRDGGEEINARVTVSGRPVPDLLKAFAIDRYPIDGRLSGDFHVYGGYTRPLGYGRLRIDDAVAYGEPFSSASAQVRFEGNGVRLDGVAIEKGAGVLNGAAFLGWNGAYSFSADGRNLPLQALEIAAAEKLPRISGLFDVTATGSATFAVPRLELKIAARDLALGAEEIGQLNGRASVRDQVVTYELEVASPRLAVSGTGRVTLNTPNDADLVFRVTDSSLEPYVRLFGPDLSTTITAPVASGTVRVTGPLSDRTRLNVEGAIERLDFRLFDYPLRNQGPVVVRLTGQTVDIDTLRLVGEDTALELAGNVDLSREALSLQVAGAANLAVLQGMLSDVRSSGRADITALVGGSLSRPQVSGRAMLTEGRLRHFSFPHALEEISGAISFDAGGIAIDAVSARLGGGPITFGGRIGISGYRVSEYDVTVEAENVSLRFPAGMRSTIDADLSLRGPAQALLLGGTVLVDSATWTRGLGGTNVFSLSEGEGDLSEAGQGGAAVSGVSAAALPLRYDVRITAPSTLRVENEQARITASADLDLRGTFDRPLLFGRAGIERGEVRFEGRRYLVTRGNLDFANPSRVQPFFDIEAETRVRAPGRGAPGQTYQVHLRLTGTTDRLQPDFTSDPPLPPLDILALLFGDAAPSGDVELTSLQQPNEREQRLLEARATRALTGALTDEVGKVVEQTFGVDTFQITPLLVDPDQQSSRLSVNPSARVTIGKRISERVYLTYSRSLSSASEDELVLLEFDQSDSFAWVLSQNEDRTYALEVRKRHRF